MKRWLITLARRVLHQPVLRVWVQGGRPVRFEVRPRLFGRSYQTDDPDEALCLLHRCKG